MAAHRGSVMVNGRQVSFIIALPRRFPHQLPVFIVQRPEELGMLPHMESDGFVCYAEREETIVDPSNPTGILRDALACVREVLEAGLTGANHDDFTEEFCAYWGSPHPKSPTIYSFIDVDDQIREVFVALPIKNGLSAFLDSPELPPPFGLAKQRRQCRFRKSIFVPFPTGVSLRPPPYGEMWTVDELREILRTNLTEAGWNSLKRLAASQHGSDYYLLLSLPRQSGDPALFGIHLKRSDGRNHSRPHPLVSPGEAFTAAPLTVKRMDREFLVQRGGGYPELINRHVTVVGCGAVGSVVADQLAKAGVGKLTLVDPDILSVDNTFRHKLGESAWQQRKAEALRADLSTHFPYLTTNAVPERIEDVLERSPDFLANTDLLVVAIGEPNIELVLNKFLHTTLSSPPAIFTWLEPLGIGGHALLTNGCGIGGCFACLYDPHHSSSQDAGLANAAAFTAPGQSFAQRPGGCRTAFVPYGAVHATQTACLTVQLATDFLRGFVDDHPLLSWKSENADFHREGYQPSRRADYDRQTIFDQRFMYKSPTCRICSPCH